MAVQHRSQLSLRRSLTIRTLIVAAAIAIMTWRNLDALKVVRLDDARMLNDALTNGIDSIWRPYAGYLQIAPRTICLIVAQMPPRYFAATLAIVSYTAWLISFWCVTYCVVARTNKFTHWWIIVILAALPPLALPIVGYFNHLQEPAFIALTSIIATPGIFHTPRKRWTLGAFILVFGVSSPLILITVIQLIFVTNPSLRSNFRSSRQLFPLLIAIFTASIQILATIFQHDRDLTWSFMRVIDGHAFIAVSFLPTFLRNEYFSVNGIDGTILRFLGALTLAVVIATTMLLLRLVRSSKAPFEIQLLGLSILSASFCVSISDSYHSGYVAPLYVAVLIFSMLRVGKKDHVVEVVTAVVLGLLLAGSLRSSFNRNLNDNFFGPTNILANLTNWDDAIRQAERECYGKNQIVRIPTGPTLDTPVILVQCGRL